MSTGIPCYCINPDCHKRENFYGYGQTSCQSCGTELMIQPQKFLLSKAIYGVVEQGNSEVFEITDLNIASPSYPQIVKILQPKATAIALKLFQQEAHLLQELQALEIPKVGIQPYCQVTVKLPQKVQPLHCLVMEKIEGFTLEAFIKNNGKANLEMSLDWLRQMAQLLLEIHRHGIIHRDIKPSNIMVVQQEGFPYGKLVLIDFGTARRNTHTYFQKLHAEQSLTKVISGSYTAPEQQVGKCTFKSDLYALGQTFIYVITGKHPHNLEENSQDWRTLVDHVLYQKLLTDLTERDAEKRLPNAQKVLDRISQILKYSTSSRLSCLLIRYQPWLKKGAIATALLSTLFGNFHNLKMPVANALVQGGDHLYEVNDKVADLLYGAALVLEKDHASAHFGKGFLSEQNGDLETAIIHYQLHLASSVGSKDYLKTYASSNLALAKINRGQDIEKAVKDLIDIIPEAEHYQNLESVHRNLGWGYLKLNNLEVADHYLTLAEMKIPEESRLQCMRAYWRQAKTTEIDLSAAVCSR